MTNTAISHEAARANCLAFLADVLAPALTAAGYTVTDPNPDGYPGPSFYAMKDGGRVRIGTKPVDMSSRDWTPVDGNHFAYLKADPARFRVTVESGNGGRDSWTVAKVSDLDAATAKVLGFLAVSIPASRAYTERGDRNAAAYHLARRMKDGLNDPRVSVESAEGEIRISVKVSQDLAADVLADIQKVLVNHV